MKLPRKLNSSLSQNYRGNKHSLDSAAADELVLHTALPMQLASLLTEPRRQSIQEEECFTIPVKSGDVPSAIKQHGLLNG